MTFRSEEMSLIQLYIPTEIAQQTTSAVGELGNIEFIDLNPQINIFQRAYVEDIKRLEEMDRKIRFLRVQLEKTKIAIKTVDLPSSTVFTRPHTQKEIDELASRLSSLESRISEMGNSQETLSKRFAELTEMRHVLRESVKIFTGEARRRSLYHEDTMVTGLLDQTNTSSDLQDAAERQSIDVELGTVAGVIVRSKMGIFERILFRALRGNLFMNHVEIAEDIIDPVTDLPVKKNVFIIFAHGKETISKIRKISESMGAALYEIDSTGEKRREAALEVIKKIEDLKNVLDGTLNARKEQLTKIAENIESWSVIVKKEKAVYHAMNLFHKDSGNNRKALIAEGWCPTKDLAIVRQALRDVAENTGSTIPPILNELQTTKTPPTFHKTNKFTYGFQAIVDAYGMATYQEVNPGLFTCISFPFLFAVMFGDFGHGILVTAFTSWMVIREAELSKKKWGEIWDMMFGGRYIILLMGCFSIYTGLIYNDMFSRAMPIFSRGYTWVTEGEKVLGVKKPTTYPIGLDPSWMISENKLMFLNSYKMKMGVVLGVIQMAFGLTLTIFNHLHFKKPINIIAESVPQILFLMAIFGYLTCIIIFKWATNWEDIGKNPPSLLNTLIFMFLSPGNVAPDDQLFPGQAPLQVFLLILAFICVPWMLCAKPYLIWKEQARHQAQGYGNLDHDHAGSNTQLSGTTGHASPTNGLSLQPPEPVSEENHDFSEVVIHQVIHTIEFVLSSISHTASYLRLWALSLAHAQLSEVLWDMVLGSVFTMGPEVAPIGLLIAFYFWFNLTVFILIMMEGLSAFLHALRLHWVEFNSKFYQAGGRVFIPFSFTSLLSDSEGF